MFVFFSDRIKLARSSKEVIQHLCSDVRQLQSLVDCEGNKIATCKEEIEEYILKLQKLDQDVQLLNSRITQVRQESRERMKQILQETEERKPRMEKAQSRHKRLVTSIANHKRGTSYLIRLTELDRRVKAAKRRQDIWDSIQGWIPTVGKLNNAQGKKERERSMSILITFFVFSCLRRVTSNFDFDHSHQPPYIVLPKLLKELVYDTLSNTCACLLCSIYSFIMIRQFNPIRHLKHLLVFTYFI